MKKKHLMDQRGYKASLFMVLFAIFGGLILLVAGHAATFATSSEAESGTLGGAAQVVSNTNASSGNAVQFGGQSGGSKPNIMVLVMENESYSDIIGNSSAPYMNSLANSYRTATSSYAIAHNSLPNYLGFVTGTLYSSFTSGQPNDDCSAGGSCLIPNGTTTLGDQLDSAGIPWDAFMETMPSNCYASDAGGAGGYVVRHDPFVYEPSLVSRDCAKIQPSTNMISAMNSASPPNFVFFSPNICHDAGGDAGCSTISAGDSFLSTTIPQIEATNWYKNGGIIILTFDEGNDDSGQSGDFGGNILTVEIAAKTAGVAKVTSYIDTFGLLRSVENAYGLSCLASACLATSGSLAL